ncbi:MAG TPA: PQQ-binding-like beta-propeller repeat protein [Streptosporangiales bacterium]
MTSTRPRLAPATLVWLLPVLGALLVAAAGALEVASGRFGGLRPPGVVVGLALVIAAVLAYRWRQRRTPLWVVAGCVLVAAVVASWYALVHLPAPGPARAADAGTMVLPWCAGLAVTGVVLVVVAGLLPADPDDAWYPAPVLCSMLAVAAVALAVAVVAGVVVVPARVTAANTSATTTSAPAPRIGPPRLTGEVAWRGLPFAGATVAGSAVLSDHGIGVVDPRTGALRWRYQRWDYLYAGSVLVEANAATSPDGRLIAVQPERDGDPSPRLQVFDAVTGRLRHSAASPRGKLLTLTAQHLVVLRSDTRTLEGGVLTAYTVAGERAWSTRLGRGCDSVASSDARTMVLGCAGDVTALDPRTGRTRWTLHSDGEALDAVPAPGGAAHLLIRATGEQRQFLRYFAVRRDDGRTAWTVPNPRGWPPLPRHVDETLGHPTGRCAAAAAGRAFVLVALCRPASGRHEPETVDLAVLRARDGRRVLHHAVPNVKVATEQPLDFPLTAAALDDGRLVFEYAGTGFPSACRLVVVERDHRDVREVSHTGLSVPGCAHELRPTPGQLVQLRGLDQAVALA